MQVHEADFDDDHELPQVKAFDKKLQETKMYRVSPQRCFPLNKGEEWLKPDYSQEPKVVFAKTTAKVNRLFHQSHGSYQNL